MISKYQESIGQDLGMKSAHGMNPDSAVMPHINMKIKWIDDSQGVPLDELKRTRQEAEDVDDVQNFEMIAVKSCKSPDYSGWDDWQNIVIETEYSDDRADLRGTQNQAPDAKEGASNQRKARGDGEAPGAQQREREG